MCTQLSDIAQQAAAIFEAVGCPDFELQITAKRDRVGAERWLLTCYNPAELHGFAYAFGSGSTPEAALGKLADSLGAIWPVRQRTNAQKEELIRVLNQPQITRAEKTQVLLKINQYTVEQCQAEIDNGKRLVNKRAGHVVYPEVAEYAVVGTAEMVAPVAA